MPICYIYTIVCISSESEMPAVTKWIGIELQAHSNTAKPNRYHLHYKNTGNKHHYHNHFLPHDALWCKVRYCDRMSSVCLSVRPSVTLVDQDHIGWKSWKLIAPTISPTPSLFVAQRPSTYSQWNMGKFGGE